MTRASSPAFLPAYRRRASSLHAAGASVATFFCAALALPFVLFEHPLVLGASLAVVALVAVAAGVRREVARAVRLGVAVALLLALINPLVSSQGETVLVRGYAVLGHRLDITLEALVYGGIAGVRLLGLVLVFALFSASTDPDELLRALRRVSYRSALTAALATRLVPVLARDASRRGDAARCRARRPSRAAMARAALAGSLERAVEVAAALEVRGYAKAGRAGAPRGRAGGPVLQRSRHDWRVGACTATLVGAAVAAKATGLGVFAAYPRIEAPVGAGEVALVALLAVLALGPFLGAGARRGIGARPGEEASAPGAARPRAGGLGAAVGADGG
jgi:energy-coupling factor transport system permease protein